ncbi:hypothetical protein EG329_004962 [Mollisiaceae sp. DMI_Dod_QoI]|nr:hypothetical protein EG329_004962 [Helotiales sp. DMI_Dod_QoI]
MFSINVPILTASLALASTVIADCSRAALLSASTSYLTSQSSGQLQPLLAPTFTYTENNKTVAFNTSILSQPLTITHNHTLLDPLTCATFTELVITDPKSPYLIGAQTHYTNTSIGSLQISTIDAVITSPGDWQFNATKSLSLILSENWSPLPSSLQSSRTALLAAANAYLDLWGPSNVTAAAANVPWGEPCDRMEGSAYTGNGTATDRCDVGIPATVQPPNVDRRYVVDEVMGSVI